MKRYYLDFEKKLEPLEGRVEEIKKFHPLPPPAGDTKKHIMKNIAPYAIYKMEN